MGILEIARKREQFRGKKGNFGAFSTDPRRTFPPSQLLLELPARPIHARRFQEEFGMQADRAAGSDSDCPWENEQNSAAKEAERGGKPARNCNEPPASPCANPGGCAPVFPLPVRIQVCFQRWERRIQESRTGIYPLFPSLDCAKLPLPFGCSSGKLGMHQPPAEARRQRNARKKIPKFPF